MMLNAQILSLRWINFLLLEIYKMKNQKIMPIALQEGMARRIRHAPDQMDLAWKCLEAFFVG